MEIVCSAILFDLDGVLVDSKDCVVRLWEGWAERNGLELEAIMNVAHGRRAVETIRLVAPHLSAEDEARRLAEIEATDMRGVVVIDGAIPLLRSLPPDAWAIVTSGVRAVVNPRLERLGLPVPKRMITADDVVKGKPDPEPYLAGAKVLGVPVEQCVVVEDAPAGIAAAKGAGMRTIAVASTHAPDELTMATAVANRLSDLAVEPGNDGQLRIRITNG